MAALSAVQKVVENTGNQGSHPVLTAVKIWKGSMVGITAAGYARPFTSGDFFAGHATETVDNTDGASADVRVICKRGIYYLNVPVFASTAISHKGDSVWATNDNHADLTRTDPTVANDLVAKVVDITDDGDVTLKFTTAL